MSWNYIFELVYVLADPIAAQVKFPFVLFTVTREDGDLRICGFEGGRNVREDSLN